MKKIMLLGAILYCLNSFAQKVDCDNLVGSWHNQRNSTLAIASINSTTGQISGSYTIINAAGNMETFPLTGYAHTKVPGTDGISTIIDFCVSFFPNYNTMTAWSGYCSSPKGVPTIHTIWHLVSAKANAPYNHITTDVDDFTPGAAAQ